MSGVIASMLEVLTSVLLSALIGILLGRKYIEAFGDPLRWLQGLVVVVSEAPLIATIATIVGTVVNMRIWGLSTSILSPDQLAQIVLSYIEMLKALLLRYVQNMLISILAGVVSYFGTTVLYYLPIRFL